MLNKTIISASFMAYWHMLCLQRAPRMRIAQLLHQCNISIQQQCNKFIGTFTKRH